MDLIGFLYGFGFVHGVILAGVLLYVRSGQRLANSFMAGLVICIAIRFLVGWFIRAGVFTEFPQWALMSAPLDFAWGPLLFLYAYSMTNKNVGRIHILHFLPCFLMFSGPVEFATYPREIQLEFLAYLYSDRGDVDLGRQVLAVVPGFWRAWIDLHLHGAAFSIQFGIYCYLVLRQIHRLNLKLEQYFSFTEQINLRWLRTLTILCVMFLLLFLVLNRGQIALYGHFEVTALILNLPFLFLVLVIYIIGFAAIYQPSIIRGVSEAAEADLEITSRPEADSEQDPEHEPGTGEELTSDRDTPAKYTRSGISLEDAQRYKIRIMKAMQDKQLYLDCDLTLRQLARQVGLTYHQVSQVINGQMNQRFFSFVNGYRIQLAKDLMTDPKTSKMAIVDLAMEVGFKSKSSFYDAFKNETQMTPTQFKKTLEADN